MESNTSKKQTNTKDEFDTVNVDCDDDEELNGESSDIEDDDEYVYESAG